MSKKEFFGMNHEWLDKRKPFTLLLEWKDRDLIPQEQHLDSSTTLTQAHNEIQATQNPLNPHNWSTKSSVVKKNKNYSAF